MNKGRHFFFFFSPTIPVARRNAVASCKQLVLSHALKVLVGVKG